MDLRTREGCIHFVESQVLPQTARLFSMPGAFTPTGVAFVQHLNGTRIDEPRAVPVQAPGISASDLRKAMRKVSERMEAVGSVFVVKDEFLSTGGHRVTAIVVQLEHTEFADLVWSARVRRGQLEPWAGPVDVSACTITVKPLRFLAHRWKS